MIEGKWLKNKKEKKEKKLKERDDFAIGTRLITYDEERMDSGGEESRQNKKCLTPDLIFDTMVQ